MKTYSRFSNTLHSDQKWVPFARAQRYMSSRNHHFRLKMEKGLMFEKIHSTRPKYYPYLYMLVGGVLFSALGRRNHIVLVVMLLVYVDHFWHLVNFHTLFAFL